SSRNSGDRQLPALAALADGRGDPGACTVGTHDRARAAGSRPSTEKSRHCADMGTLPRRTGAGAAGGGGLLLPRLSLHAGATGRAEGDPSTLELAAKAAQ